MDLLLTPFRWYNKYHKQNRFDKDCHDTCEFKLITDRRHLLPFQFTRPASGYPIANWIVRKACTPPQPLLLTPEESTFAATGRWVQGDWSLGKGWAKPDADVPGTLTMAGIMTSGKTYKIYISVIESSTPDVGIIVVAAGNTLGTLTDTGLYEFTFVAIGSDLVFTCDPSGDSADIIRLDSVQIYAPFEVDTASGDVELDPALIQMYNNDTIDYLVYCGTSLEKDLATCDYYSIIETGDGLLFFSEVFTVKSFLPEASPYFILEWRNTCDINNILYSGVECTYSNKLYLDEAVISKPEYPIQEEGQQDGNLNFNPTFQKWEKKVEFMIAKCPEFIVDALTGIRLHDTIRVKKPLRIGQPATDVATLIKSVESELTNIFNDCYQNVILKILLDDKYVDSACCTNIDLVECEECSLSAGYEILDTDIGYALYPGPGIVDDISPGLYQYNALTEEWEEVTTLAGTVVCAITEVGDPNPVNYMNYLGNWIQIPAVFDWGGDSGWAADVIHVEGVSFTGSYIQVEISTDGGTNWVLDSQIVTVIEYLTAGIDIPWEAAQGNAMIRVHSFTVSCDYGYSKSYAFTV